MGTLTKPIAYPSQDILRFLFPVTQIPTWTVTNTNSPDETISVPAYTNGELAGALAQYIADIPVQEAADAAAETAEAQQIVDMINNSGAAGSLAPSLITQSGRHYLRNNRWYTGADDQYGYTYYQNNEQAGSGSAPTMEWEHLGLYLPAGRKLGNLHIAGRTNSTSVSDIELYIALRYPDAATRWETGFDHDNEMDFTLLYHDMYAYPSVGAWFTGGNMSDMRRRTIDLDHTVAQDSFFSIYMRPVSSSSSTRYFYHTWTLEVY